MKVKAYVYGERMVLVVIGNTKDHKTHIEILDLKGKQLVKPVVL